MFSIFKKKDFFTTAEKERIVEAIRLAEMETSGEIKVYVESKNPFVDPIDRAKEQFTKLNMEHTEHRNGVLLYIALKHKELALYGDEGIYKAVGKEYWNNTVQQILAHFSADNICEGIVQCIKQIGETLKEKFPYSSADDQDELPDEIVFGK